MLYTQQVVSPCVHTAAVVCLINSWKGDMTNNAKCVCVCVCVCVGFGLLREREGK